MGGEREQVEERLSMRFFQPPAIMLQSSPTASSMESSPSSMGVPPSMAEAIRRAPTALRRISQEPRMEPEKPTTAVRSLWSMAGVAGGSPGSTGRPSIMPKTADYGLVGEGQVLAGKELLPGVLAECALGMTLVVLLGMIVVCGPLRSWVSRALRGEQRLDVGFDVVDGERACGCSRELRR